MLSDQLVALNARRVLVRAAIAGTLTELACAMTECVCPNGRSYFERFGIASPWAPSADRFPLAGRDGGLYRIDNVRLAHKRCNTLAGTRITHEHRRASGQYQSASYRAHGARLRLIGLPALRAWQASPESREVYIERGQRLAAWCRSAEGRARQRADSRNRSRDAVARQTSRLIAYAQSPGGRAKSSEIAKDNGRRLNCGRWGVSRGKPCVCGHHEATV